MGNLGQENMGKQTNGVFALKRKSLRSFLRQDNKKENRKNHKLKTTNFTYPGIREIYFSICFI